MPMKTVEEKVRYAADIIDRYRGKYGVAPTSNALDLELKGWCKEGVVGHARDRTTVVKMLNAVSCNEGMDSGSRALAEALIPCVNGHPRIEGAYGVGTHADLYAAQLNDSVVDVIGCVAVGLEWYMHHPDS